MFKKILTCCATILCCVSLSQVFAGEPIKIQASDDPMQNGQNLVDAIVSAEENSIIYLEEGVFQGNFQLNKSLDIYGGFIGDSATWDHNTSERIYTICDGNQNGRVFTIYEGKSVILDGLTIQNGKTESSGGGVYVEWNSSLSISDCNVSDNYANYSGGGIYAGWNSSLSISNCSVSGNYASGDGGGIYAPNSTIQNCEITDNIAGYSSGGVYASIVNNCLIVNNHTKSKGSYSVGGIRLSYEGYAENCLIWGNTNASGYCQAEKGARIYRSSVQGINLDADNMSAEGPQFVDPYYGYYAIFNTSKIPNNVVSYIPRFDRPEYAFTLTVQNGISTTTSLIEPGSVIQVNKGNFIMGMFIEWTSPDITIDIPTAEFFEFNMPEKDVTIKANYAYYCNIWTPDGEIAEEKRVGEIINITAPAEYEGRKFTSWSDVDNVLDKASKRQNSISFVMPEYSFELSAQYQDTYWYSVYESDDIWEEFFYDDEAVSGSIVTVSAPTNINGRKFISWDPDLEFLDADSLKLNPVSFIMPDDDVSLGAIYQKNYTVYSEYGDEIASGLVTPGDKLTITCPKEVEGIPCEFIEWDDLFEFLDPALLKLNPVTFIMPNHDIVFTAICLDTDKTKNVWLNASYQPDSAREGITLELKAYDNSFKKLTVYRMELGAKKGKKVGTFDNARKIYRIVDEDPKLEFNVPYVYYATGKVKKTKFESNKIRAVIEGPSFEEFIDFSSGSLDTLYSSDVHKGALEDKWDFDVKPTLSGWYKDDTGKKPKTKKISFKAIDEKANDSVITFFTKTNVPMFTSKLFTKRTDSALQFIADSQSYPTIYLHAKKVNKKLKYTKDYRTDIMLIPSAPFIDTMCVAGSDTYFETYGEWDYENESYKRNTYNLDISKGVNFDLEFHGQDCGYAKPKVYIEYMSKGKKYKLASLKVTPYNKGEKDKLTGSQYTFNELKWQTSSRFKVTIPAKKWVGQKGPWKSEKPTCIIISTGKGMFAIPINLIDKK